MTTSELTRPSGAARTVVQPRLGEELPIFCERCGYSLHGLPQARCERCEILHFHCPECGHHQPINTLRPAAQRILGRLRAVGLVLLVLFKIVLIGWPLIGWFVLGVELSLERDYSTRQTVVVSGQIVQRAGPTYSAMPLHLEFLLGTGMFALAFGAVSRMALLRWRRGYLVGLALAGLAVAAMALGAHVNYLAEVEWKPPWPFTDNFMILMGWSGLITVIGASIVWPIWVMLVTVFLPKPAAAALLGWQRHLPHSGGDGSALARD